MRSRGRSKTLPGQRRQQVVLATAINQMAAVIEHRLGEHSQTSPNGSELKIKIKTKQGQDVVGTQFGVGFVRGVPEGLQDQR